MHLLSERARQRNSGSFKHHREHAELIYISTCLKKKRRRRRRKKKTTQHTTTQNTPHPLNKLSVSLQTCQGNKYCQTFHFHYPAFPGQIWDQLCKQYPKEGRTWSPEARKKLPALPGKLPLNSALFCSVTCLASVTSSKFCKVAWNSWWIWNEEASELMNLSETCISRPHSKKVFLLDSLIMVLTAVKIMKKLMSNFMQGSLKAFSNIKQYSLLLD